MNTTQKSLNSSQASANRTGDRRNKNVATINVSAAVAASKRHKKASTTDNSLMIPAGNPSESPSKRQGKKMQKEIIMEESESPARQQTGEMTTF
jgi:hypothetical protein